MTLNCSRRIRNIKFPLLLFSVSLTWNTLLFKITGASVSSSLLAFYFSSIILRSSVTYSLNAQESNENLILCYETIAVKTPENQAEV